MSSQRAGNSSVLVVVAGARVSRSKQSNQKKVFSPSFSRQLQTKTNLRCTIWETWCVCVVVVVAVVVSGGGSGGEYKKREKNIPQYPLSLACLLSVVLGGVGWDRWMGSVFLRYLPYVW